MKHSARLSSRDAIIQAAFAILSRDSGATLTEIAERAGVGRATLHRYFPSREDLIRALAWMAIEEIDQAAAGVAEAAGSFSEALEKVLGALIPLGDRHGFLAREPVEQDSAITAEFERQMRETRELVEAAKREGAFDTSVPTGWIVQAYEHLLYAAGESVRAEDITPAQSADLAWRTLTSGLGGSK